MKFLNRVDDLAALDDLWTAAGARLFVLWGRRRVGKTELLGQFAQGKRSCYFEATDTTERNQLRGLSDELATASANRLLAQQPLTSWAAALAAIAQFASDGERTLVVLDEFQYLARQQPELATLLNRGGEPPAVTSRWCCVIAGSEVRFFRDEVLGGADVRASRRPARARAVRPPLRRTVRRRSTRHRTRSVRTRSAVACRTTSHASATTSRCARTSSRNVLYRDGFLHEEADLLLRQELPDPRRYFAVLDAIARGATRNSQIANATGLNSAQTYQTLDMLERLQLVEQLRPATASPTSKKTAYAVRDGFLNFYFRFVEPYKSRMRTRGDAERHLEQTVLPNLDAFVSKPAWERICQEHVRRQEPEALSVGAWWGKVQVAPRRTEERELDVVAVAHGGDVIATGSCKWTGAPLDYGEEKLLTQVEAHIPGADSVQRHYFFSRSGFTDQLRKLAASDPDRYRLVGPEDVYR